MSRPSHQIDLPTIEREVRYAESIWNQGTVPLAAGLADEVIADIYRWSNKTKPLAAGERAVVSLFRPKTASLFADRVWLQWAGEEEELDFGFGWESPVSARLGALQAFVYLTTDPSERDSWAKQTDLTPPAARFAAFAERQLTASYAAVTGATVVPLFPSYDTRDLQYTAGDLPVILGVIENLNIVSERDLSWQQVLEFRSDRDATAAYRRFVNWLDRDMLGRPVQYIVDTVGGRLEAYDWALKKHGIKTAVGALESMLNAEALLGSSAVGAAVHWGQSSPGIAALAAGGVLAGRAAVSVVNRLIERADIRAEHRDIAFVQEIRERIGLTRHAADGGGL